MRDNAHQTDKTQTGNMTAEHNQSDALHGDWFHEQWKKAEDAVGKLIPSVIVLDDAAKTAHDANPANAPVNKFLPELTITH